jgi:hypothetical protein
MVNLVAYIVNSGYLMVTQVDYQNSLVSIATRADAPQFNVAAYSFLPTPWSL